MIRFVRLAILAALAVGSAIAAHAQTCPATALPYTDSFSGTGALNACVWTPVIGPAGSIAAVQSGGFAVPGAASGYTVEMFTALPGATSNSGSITFAAGNYSGRCLDQNATGAGVCLIPSTSAIMNMVGNSGASPGGQLCNWSSAKTAPQSGDVFSLTKAAGVYTATDVTKGETLCSIAFTEPSGNPSVQVDWRGTTGADKIGPTTLSGAPASGSSSASESGIQIDVPTAPATAWIITLTNFNFIPGIDPGSWAFSCSAPVAAAAPTPPSN